VALDRLDAGMGQWAADEGDILQAGDADIGDVLTASAQEAIVLLAAESGADSLSSAGPGAGQRGRLQPVPSAVSITPRRARSGRDGLRQDRRHCIVTHTGAQAEKRLQQTVRHDFRLLVIAQNIAPGFCVSTLTSASMPGLSAPITSDRPSIFCRMRRHQ